MTDTKTAHWYEPDDKTIREWNEWVESRPPHVAAVAKRFPPWTLWKLELNGDDGKPEEEAFLASFKGGQG